MLSVVAVVVVKTGVDDEVGVVAVVVKLGAKPGLGVLILGSSQTLCFLFLFLQLVRELT